MVALAAGNFMPAEEEKIAWGAQGESVGGHVGSDKTFCRFLSINILSEMCERGW